MDVKKASNPVAAPPPRPLDKSRSNRSKHKGADTGSGHTETWQKNNQLMLELGPFAFAMGAKKTLHHLLQKTVCVKSIDQPQQQRAHT